MTEYTFTADYLFPRESFHSLTITYKHQPPETSFSDYPGATEEIEIQTIIYLESGADLTNHINYAHPSLWEQIHSDCWKDLETRKLKC